VLLAAATVPSVRSCCCLTRAGALACFRRFAVANRVLTVGSQGRAEKIATFLDAEPAPFKHTSGRGFTTITGKYKGVDVSIVAIGMVRCTTAKDYILIWLSLGLTSFVCWCVCVRTNHRAFR